MEMKRKVKRRLEAGFIFVFNINFNRKWDYRMRRVKDIALHLIKSTC